MVVVVVVVVGGEVRGEGRILGWEGGRGEEGGVGDMREGI